MLRTASMLAWLQLHFQQVSYCALQKCRAVGVARESPFLDPQCPDENRLFLRKLAWANTGSIAYIAADGSKVSFYALVRDMKAKMWAISAESKFSIKAPPDRTFVHVQFSGMGIDLAIVDSAGMVHLRTLAGALGRMIPAERDPARVTHPKNELDAVVGMHWLSLWPAEFTVRSVVVVSLVMC